MIPVKKSTLIIVIILMIVALSACTLGEAPQPTPTPVDINAVMTSAASTAFVELTSIAAAVPPTSTPTIPPTETTVQTATNTPEGGATAAETSAITGTNATAQPSLTPIAAGGSGVSTAPLCKSAEWTGVESIPDGTTFSPGQRFTKTWQFKNTGICTWDVGFVFKMWSGDTAFHRGDPFKITQTKDFIEPGEVVDMSIDFAAPDFVGQGYLQHWKWFDDDGKAFGQDVTIVINVQ